MAFPLPIDPVFRKEIVWIWIHDIGDRLKLNDIEGANASWKIANEIYLSLPSGEGSPAIEDQLFQQRVKVDNLLQQNNEDNL